jgi:DNA polymerase sigma
LNSVRAEREKVVKIVTQLIKEMIKNAVIKQYGSMASNLAVDSSDVDLAVTSN